MKPTTKTSALLSILAAVLSISPTAQGGIVGEDWIIFEDFVSGAECGVINASNAELISLFDDGTMVIVSGADAVLVDLIVTSEDEVLYRNLNTGVFEPAGFIEFLDDGDGFPAVFWTSLVGTVVEVDTFTGEPFDSGILPDERINTGCDACELIDDSPLCDVDNGGGNNGGNNGGNGGNIPGDIFFPFPVLCGAGSPAIILMALLAAPVVRSQRARRR